MMRYALHRYIPRRRIARYPFEQQDVNRMIIGFKDGRNVYTRWAAREFAKVLSQTDLSDVVIVCVPASTTYSHTRRWKRFLSILCTMTGAENGYEYVKVVGSRKRAHTTGEYELATNIKHYVHLKGDMLQGRKVLVIDDIYTTGRSSGAFISALENVGAHVVMAMFLAKTPLRTPR